MSEAILTILKFCFLGLLYLFLARVVRAVYRELSPDRPLPVTSNGNRFGLGGRGRGGKADQSAKPYKLKMIDPATSQIFPLGEEVTIGRAPGCSVPLADDTYVSQLHARIYVRDGKPFVEDLGSTNGTFLNRDRLSRTMPLRRGDKLQIGQTVLEIVQ
ncbi:MAG TPA: FHA domain-containing protein [Acidimicrobiia bacterium]|nr:FHA domain-containing protein [Acidimicrobiia bacterium]